MNSLTAMNTSSRRPFFGQIAKTIGVLTLATSVALPAIAQTAANAEGTLTRQVYEAFQRGQLDRWDGLFAEDAVRKK